MSSLPLHRLLLYPSVPYVYSSFVWFSIVFASALHRLLLLRLPLCVVSSSVIALRTMIALPAAIALPAVIALLVAFAPPVVPSPPAAIALSLQNTLRRQNP